MLENQRLTKLRLPLPNDQKPAETIILAPHQKFPDVAKLNADVPREEWVEGPDGNPRGPWQAQHIVYLLDPTTMDRFSFPTGTIGGAIAVRDLTDKVKWMRRFRGQSVLAVVSLRDVFMPTKVRRPAAPALRGEASGLRLGGDGETAGGRGTGPGRRSAEQGHGRSLMILPRRRRRRPSRRADRRPLKRRRQKKSSTTRLNIDGCSSMPLSGGRRHQEAIHQGHVPCQ